jgi:hypothetical protein
MASNPTERLNYENYITQGHKHLAQGNKSCGKRRVLILTFWTKLS